MTQLETLQKPGTRNMPLDLQGNRYGMLVVMGPQLQDNGVMGWLCQCDCGETIAASTKALRDGEKRSCGCTRLKPEDLTGRTVGMLTVIGKAPRTPKQKVAMWDVRCACGTVQQRRTRDLMDNGRIHSCGCTRSAEPMNAKAIKREERVPLALTPSKQPTPRPAALPLSRQDNRVVYRCVCGSTKVVSAAIWDKGIKTCSCAGMGEILFPREDHVGEKHGRLTVVSWAPQPAGEAQSKWDCLCDCGKARTASYAYLTKGKLVSCGCLLSEVRRLPRGSLLSTS